MGYDFTFCSLGPRGPLKFPCTFQAAPKTPVPIPWPALRKRILERGARANGSGGALLLELADGASIGFYGSENGLALDVHSDWSHVLALYKAMLADAPDLVIFDPQEGCFHDEASFRQLMADNQELNRQVQRLQESLDRRAITEAEHRRQLRELFDAATRKSAERAKGK